MTSDSTPTPEPEPSKSTPATPETTTPQPDPVADLQPGGFFDRLLEKPMQGNQGSVNQLYRDLAEDYQKVKDAMKSPNYFLNHFTKPESHEVPRWLVVFQTEQYRVDPVLRFCLGLRWRIEDKNGRLHDEAIMRYQERPNDYDHVLGDRIPSDFHDEGHLRFAQRCFNEGSNHTAEFDWPEYRRRLRQRQGSLLGLSTGISSLDSALRGLRGLIFLGGSTGVGKSSLALFIAVQALQTQDDLGVIYYSLDMPKTVLYDRLLCQEAGVDFGELIKEQRAEDARTKLNEADKRLVKDILPRLRIIERISIDVSNPSAFGAESRQQVLWEVIVEDLKQLIVATAVENVLVIVDYFQLLPVPRDVLGGLEADFYRVAALQRVQNWSRTNDDPIGFPILAITEVRKGESGRTELNSSDLMGSARLAYSAESVLLLEPTKEGNEGPVVPITLNIAKARDGSARTKINLLFEHTKSRFSEAPAPRSPKKGTKAKGPANTEKADPYAGLEG